MYYGKTHSDNSVPWYHIRTRTILKAAIIFAIFSLFYIVNFYSSSFSDNESLFASIETLTQTSKDHQQQKATPKPRLSTKLEKQQYKRIIALENEIQSLREQARSNKYQTAHLLNTIKKKLAQRSSFNKNSSSSDNQNNDIDADLLNFGGFDEKDVDLMKQNKRSSALLLPPPWLTADDIFELVDESDNDKKVGRQKRVPFTFSGNNNKALRKKISSSSVSTNDDQVSGEVSSSSTSDFGSKQYYMSIVKGATFIVSSSSENEDDLNNNVFTNQHRDEKEDSKNYYHSSVSFNKRATKCFGKLASGLLKKELTDVVRSFVQSQLVYKRYELENASINEQHEEWIVRPSKYIEKQYYTEARMTRAVGACFLGGGLGVDRPHGQEHWAERGGGDAIKNRHQHHDDEMLLLENVTTSATNKKSSISSLISNSSNNNKQKDNHPLFFPLHGGVSPRRLIKQAFRAAEYLGFGLSTSSSLSSSVTFSSAITGGSTSLRHERPIKSFFKRNRAGREKSKIIVDLGCGHGAMLAAMCPPHPRLWCYGIDMTSALIERGRRAFPHLDLRPGIAASHIPSGAADAVLSNGVAGILRLSQNCLHLQEVLRLLRPGRGVGLVWQLSSSRWGRFHPSFFADASSFYLNETRFKNSATSQIEEIFDFVPDFGRVMVDPFFMRSSSSSNPHHQHHDSKRSDDQKNHSENVDDESKFPSENETNFMNNIKNSTEATMTKNQNQNQRNNNKNQNSSTANYFPNRIFKLKSHHKFLSRCPGNLGRYISRIDIIASDPHSTIYTPMWDSTDSSLQSWAGTFGVRIFRNSKKFDEKNAVKEDDARISGRSSRKREDNHNHDHVEGNGDKNKYHDEHHENQKKDVKHNNDKEENQHLIATKDIERQPPIGLQKMVYPERFPFFAKNTTTSNWFQNDPMKYFLAERVKYQHAIDVALRCRNWMKMSGESNGGGWCPRSRVKLS